MTGPAPEQGGTTSQFKTGSMLDVKKSLRRLLLDYRNAGGRSAREILDERMWDTRARDNQPTFPYAVFRLQTQNPGTYHGMRLDGNLEVQVYGRPFSQQEAVEAVADLFDQCMVSRLLRRQGLIFCHGFTRQTLPVAGAAIDSEVVTVRLGYQLAIWPALLTDLTTVLPPE